jgi:hypothetical protein
MLCLVAFKCLCEFPCEVKRETDPSLLQLVYVYVLEMKENPQFMVIVFLPWPLSVRRILYIIR